MRIEKILTRRSVPEPRTQTEKIGVKPIDDNMEVTQMLMEKLFSAMKPHSSEACGGNDEVRDHVTVRSARKQLAHSMDAYDAVCRLNQGGHIQMSKL